MEFIKLDATVRKTTGKGAARRMRNTGHVPAVIYGRKTETTAIAVVPDLLVKALAGALRVNTPLNITVKDTETKKTTETLAIVKDHQYDPITRNLLHVDFLAIAEDAPVTVDVPIEKEGRSKGEQLGGVIRMVHRKVPVVCLPKDIPAKLVIDVTELGPAVTFHVSEMKLPEGVVVDYPPQEALLTISSVVVEDETDETAAAAAPTAAPAEK